MQIHLLVRLSPEINKKECGSITVEASIYFPITIAIVMAVIYLGLFKMQESYFFFQVERTASQFAKEIAYPGYESFQNGKPLEGTAVDFDWEQGPSEEQVRSYYEAYQGSLTRIYRLGLDTETETRLGEYQEALCRSSALFSLGTTETYIKVDKNFLSQSVLAEIRYELPTPGILRYIGVKDKICLYAGAYQPIMNTSDFVRNVDLAWDLGNFLMEKLGLGEKTSAFIDRFNKLKEILF